MQCQEDGVQFLIHRVGRSLPRTGKGRVIQESYTSVSPVRRGYVGSGEVIAKFCSNERK